MMRLLFPLLGHLLVTLARLARPGGIHSVVAESLAVKHQLLIMKRSQRRAPNLTSWDRLIVLRKNLTAFRRHGPRGCTRGEVRSLRGRSPLDLLGRNDAFGVEAARGDSQSPT